MKTNRRDFLRRGLVGAAALGAGSLAPLSGAETAASPDRRKLGRIGTEVSILGLGLGSVFTNSHESDPEAALALLKRAADAGVNYWDTANAYGPSQRIIGPVVKELRSRIFLVSKSGDRSYDGFRRELDKSLTELQTDRIDLFHLHNFDPKRDSDLDAIEKGAVRAARKAKEEGLIGHFGITGHSGAGILVDCINRFNPDAVLTIFPATRPDDGRYEDQLLPLAREKDLGVIAMKTVRYARDADLKGTDLIRYALSLDGVHCAIVGLDTLAHLNENIAMATGFQKLERDRRVALHEHVRDALQGSVAPWDRPGYEDAVRA